MPDSLTDRLLAETAVSPEQLDAARQRAQQEGVSFLAVLAEAVPDTVVAAAVRVTAAHLGLPFVLEPADHADPAALQLVSVPLLRSLQVLPLQVAASPDGNRLLVAASDPERFDRVRREVSAASGLPVSVALAPSGALLAALDAAVARGSGVVASPPGGRASFDLDEALREMVAAGASDLHLTVGLAPTIRRHGELAALERFGVLGSGAVAEAVEGVLPEYHLERFAREWELDTAYEVAGLARFRLNVFRQRGEVAATLRAIPSHIPSLRQLGIPPVVERFSSLPNGLVLVTGTSGAGKTTTLAAMIDAINAQRAGHILTVEDPVEFIHPHRRGLVNQREVGEDTRSFADALKHALRQDPDVILVGETRDLETISIALTAAETGHLVFATMHTQSAPQTVERIVDVFPPSQQEQVRVQLAGTLRGVVCQQLLRRADGAGRVAGVEVLVGTPAVRNLIREGKTHQLQSVMQAGRQEGMVLMDQMLAGFVSRGVVSFDHALERASDRMELARLCGRTLERDPVASG